MREDIVQTEIKLLNLALIHGGHTDSALQPNHFKTECLGAIWKDIKNEFEPNVLAMTARHDEKLLADIVGNGWSYAVDFSTAANLIIDDHHRRTFLRELDVVKGMIEGGMTPETAMKKLTDIETTSVGGEPVPLMNVMREVYKEVEAVSSGEKELNTYIPTGLADFDRIYFGIERGAYTVIAARPSMGKSAFSMGLALHAAKIGKKVLVLSLEMSNNSLVYRIFSTQSGLNLQSLRSGQIKTAESWRKMAAATSSMKDYVMFLDDTPALNLSQLLAKVRKHHKKNGLDMVVIDYLGLMTTDNKNQKKFEYISEISNAMPALAKELNICLVALSQLGRDVEKRPDKRPMLSDLRDSGSVEQDADAVIMLYREEYYHKKPGNEGLAEIIMQKQRNGPTGTIRAHFDKQCATFKNLGGAF